jgi:hypothetical protein
MNFLSRFRTIKHLAPINKTAFHIKSYPLGELPEELKYDRPYSIIFFNEPKNEIL